MPPDLGHCVLRSDVHIEVHRGLNVGVPKNLFVQLKKILQLLKLQFFAGVLFQ